MHRGRVMESGPVDDIFRDARHPYLKALMRAVPRFNMAPGERLTPIREVRVATDHLISGRGRPHTQKKREGPLLEVRGLSRYFATRSRSMFGAPRRVESWRSTTSASKSAPASASASSANRAAARRRPRR